MSCSDCSDYENKILGKPQPKTCLFCGHKNKFNANICENCGLHLD